tara:strand:+ start:3788 stop:4723 length:936 start_codon:yes stop_codon:yes gene_type:complete
MTFIFYILGFLSSAIYLFNAYQTMVYLVGGFWATIWTFVMPLGILTLPFWANFLYDFSSTNLWISYFTPLFFYFISDALIFNKKISFFSKPKSVELSSGLFVELENELPETSRIKRLGAFLIDYGMLYYTLNFFNLEWTANIDNETLTYVDEGITGGLFNSIILLTLIWFLYFWAVPIFTKGSTLGKLIFRIRLYSVKNDSIEIPSSIVIFQREALRLICIVLATYGSFIIPGDTTIAGGLYQGFALTTIFFLLPYIVILGKSKRTLFDSLIQTIVASRFVDFSLKTKVSDYEEYYNSEIFDEELLLNEEE